MHEIDLRSIDLNLLVVFDVLMTERSVTRATARLGRTQSAVSHALARLRTQVDDPLLIKQGGRMIATPFAERLVEDLKPILSSIQRALVPLQTFDPATTTRTFRLGMLDGLPTLFPRLAARVLSEAPRATLDWVPEGPQRVLAAADGQLDVAMIPAAVALPEGVTGEEVAGDLKWASFVRKGHPAIATWGRQAWSRWPHVVVRVANPVPSPVTTAHRRSRERTIGARVPTFSDVAPLIARTDMIATFPIATLVDAVKLYHLQLLPPPFPIARFPHRMIWSTRLGNDPAIGWIRNAMRTAIEEVADESERYHPAIRRSNARKT
jgi:DNA-binding transcriptional LysR family regulator